MVVHHDEFRPLPMVQRMLHPDDLSVVRLAIIPLPPCRADHCYCQAFPSEDGRGRKEVLKQQITGVSVLVGPRECLRSGRLISLELYRAGMAVSG